jgi:hypothetical protein
MKRNPFRVRQNLLLCNLRTLRLVVWFVREKIAALIQSKLLRLASISPKLEVLVQHFLATVSGCPMHPVPRRSYHAGLEQMQ